uniref:peptidyl-prolyl cis-trans isomerase B-like n=1 Tax=Styela clava TaxID=7725 RepID=UPI00193A985A|nr:peptidyl-prolyl cis-trans isomerase B-like [Styela clava]
MRDMRILFIACISFGTVQFTYSTKDPLVTDLVYFDVTIGKEEAGRIVFGLFGKVVPKTAENFLRLAVHDKGYGYTGSRFTKIHKTYSIIGGSFTHGDTKGGISWFGAPFECENYDLRHYGPGWVSMASVGRGDLGSQFHIITEELYGMRAWFDKRYVVFAAVVYGMDLVLKIENMETYGMIPTTPVVVKKSGTLKLEKPFRVEREYITDDIVSWLGEKLWDN